MKGRVYGYNCGLQGFTAVYIGTKLGKYRDVIFCILFFQCTSCHLYNDYLLCKHETGRELGGRTTYLITEMPICHNMATREANRLPSIRIRRNAKKLLRRPTAKITLISNRGKAHPKVGGVQQEHPSH